MRQVAEGQVEIGAVMVFELSCRRSHVRDRHGCRKAPPQKRAQPRLGEDRQPGALVQQMAGEGEELDLIADPLLAPQQKMPPGDRLAIGT